MQRQLATVIPAACHTPHPKMGRAKGEKPKRRKKEGKNDGW